MPHFRSITDDLAVLRSEVGAGPRRRADPLWMRGIEYVFVTAIEACVAVADQIVPARLDDLSDRAGFVAAVAGWVSDRT